MPPIRIVVAPGLLPFDLTRGGSLFDFHATAQHQSVRVLRAGRDHAGQLPVQGRLPRGALRRPGSPTTAPSRASASPTTSRRPAPCCASPTPERSKRRSTRICCSPARPESAGWLRTSSEPTPVPIQPGYRNQFNTGLAAGHRQVPAGGRRLLLEVHAQRVRLQHAAEHHASPSRSPGTTRSSTASPAASAPPTCTASRPTGRSAIRARDTSRRKIGGLISQGAPLAGGVFRIDHDQAFQSTGVFRYQHKNAEWIASHLAVRQRPGGERRAGCRRGAGADRRAAGVDRPGLRRMCSPRSPTPSRPVQRPGHVEAAHAAASRPRRTTTTIPTA